MAADLSLASGAIEWLTEVDKKDIEDREYFSYSFNRSKITVLPAELHLVRRSASGSEVPKSERPETWPSF